MSGQESLAVAEESHSSAFMDHAKNPRHLGVLPEPAHYARARGACGDVIELYIRVEEERITAARFMPQGCIHTMACGSALTSLIDGVPLEKAAGVKAEDVEDTLGGLTREHRHCAVIAVAALRAAMRRYYEDRKSPWKKLYRR